MKTIIIGYVYHAEFWLYVHLRVIVDPSDEDMAITSRNILDISISLYLFRSVNISTNLQLFIRIDNLLSFDILMIIRVLYTNFLWL